MEAGTTRKQASAIRLLDDRLATRGIHRSFLADVERGNRTMSILGAICLLRRCCGDMPVEI